MAETDKGLDLPEETVQDKAHQVTKILTVGAAGLIGSAAGGVGAAIVGGGMQALAEIFFRDPWREREKEWCERVVEALSEIQARQADIEPDRLIERLKSDPEFVTTLQQATAYAFRSHQQEKLEALRNALINSALPNAPEMDLRSVFLRLVDELSPTHLRLLWVCSDPLRALEDSGALSKLSRRSESSAFTPIIEAALPELSGRGARWHPFAQHLTNEGLVHSLFDPGTAPFYEALADRTTPLGREFLNFIQPPAVLMIDPADLLARSKMLARLREELATRARSQRFNVAPVRRIEVGSETLLETIAVRFPREAARSPVLNGNPPSIAELRLSIISPSIIDVFAFGQKPEHVGSQPLDFELGAAYGINSKKAEDPGRAADALIGILEAVFPDRGYWTRR